MDSLPILVPVVAAALCIPGVFFCGCYRALSARLTALEGRVNAAASAAARHDPHSPPSSGYLGGVTYGPPPPSAPSATYPVYLTPTRPLPQAQAQSYWSPQAQMV